MRIFSKEQASVSERVGSRMTPRCQEYKYRKIEPIEPILFPKIPDRALVDNLRHNLSSSAFGEIFSSCSPTSQVQVVPKCPNWELQTFDEQGNPKTIGGDEFYITYTDKARYEYQNQNSSKYFHMLPFTAAAWVTDLMNGRYLLDFQASPFFTDSFTDLVESGVLAIYFQYTCQTGRMGPQRKLEWTFGGNTVASYKSGILPAPPIRSFDIPVEVGRPQFHDFDTIIPIGDSLLQQFLEPFGLHFDNIWKSLNSSNVVRWKRALREEIGKKKHLVQETTAIVTGSCIWDILEDQNVTTSTTDGSSEWSDHRFALQEFLGHVRLKYPNVTLFWKSCTGVHIHVPVLYREHEEYQRRHMHRRLRCMSTSRAAGLYSIQKETIQREILRREKEGEVSSSCKQRLFFLDVYPAYYLSAYHARDGDGLHYGWGMNRQALSWFANASLD